MYFKTLIWLVLLYGCTQSKTSTMNALRTKPSTLESYQTPDYLTAGDTVIIVAPAGILKGRKQAIENAQKLLKNWGLAPVLGAHVFSHYHHFAGDDTQRKSDMQWALDHPTAKAIWCARGGYGSVRILDYLNLFETPEVLFENLIFNRETIDKHSIIVDDYVELQQYFQGVSTSNGMEYGLRYFPGSNFDIYGYVRYVHPGSVADQNNIKRGDIFFEINNTSLNLDNYSSFLSMDSYSVNFADYFNNNTPEIIDDTIVSNNITVDLYKVSLEKNPIFHSDIIENSDGKSGYLLYNQFTSTFDDELTEVFANFKSNNIDNLILDLRYNSGGSINSAILISSLITGQFTNEIFSTEQWNNEIQSYWLNNDPEYLINRFIGNSNSLNLNKVIIITSRSSASASELVINCLKPYIDVIQVGTTTYGKYQASVTLYDSTDFSLNGVNPSHNYALQPLVLKTLNSLGETDYYNGLNPDILAEEDSSNLGIIGDIDEPVLFY